MKIRIKKLKELPDAINPNNIPVDFEETFELSNKLFKKPTVGDRFYASNIWSTSGVQEVVDEKTFRTYSSVYQWEITDYTEMIKKDEVEITRVEVINHAKNSHPVGRLLTLYKSMGDFNYVELAFQDGRRTLKIFLD